MKNIESFQVTNYICDTSENNNVWSLQSLQYSRNCLKRWKDLRKSTFYSNTETFTRKKPSGQSWYSETHENIYV